MLLLSLAAAGLALYGARVEPAPALRPVRAASSAEVGRAQVEAVLGVRRSGRERVSPEAPIPPPPDSPPPPAETDAPKPRPASRARAKALNARGLAAYRRGLPDDALALYSQALAADPTYHWAHYNAACMVALTGDVEAAIEHLQSWQRHSPTPPDAPTVTARVRKDPDFDPIRTDPRWTAWLASLRPRPAP